MRISELLNENQHPKHKSALPTAASLNDEPQDEFDDEVDSEDGDDEVENTIPGLEEFKKVAAQFGPDLYSFTSMECGDAWSARNATPLAAKLQGNELEGMDDAVRAMMNADGDDGALTFIIVNGRTGQAVAASFGENGVSDGIMLDDLDADQQQKVNHINDLNDGYVKNGGGLDDEPNKYATRYRDAITMSLHYYDQPIKSDRPQYPIFQVSDKTKAKTLKWAIDRARSRGARHSKDTGYDEWLKTQGNK
jgi:hypothetical protein